MVLNKVDRNFKIDVVQDGQVFAVALEDGVDVYDL
jgi:hypothetical protein